jgi:spore coat polysaccharide biosynthesis protein SpsF (cytidylyltransferase family)
MQHGKVVGIIQARMSSTRLPGKVLADLAGKPLLYHVVQRAKQAASLQDVLVATTDRPADDQIAQACASMGFSCYRGSEDDVLDRYYQAARCAQSDVVVRLTADCPLLDPHVIDRVVTVFLEGDFDYVSNTIEPSYPDGLDTEVFSAQALERAWREAKLKSEREHVTPYIWKQPALFRLHCVKHEPDLSALRWTVDEPEDLEFVRRVYAALGSTTVFGMQEVIALIERRPDLRTINAGFERNEGYHKSLREDTTARTGDAR